MKLQILKQSWYGRVFYTIRFKSWYWPFWRAYNTTDGLFNKFASPDEALSAFTNDKVIVSTEVVNTLTAK